MAGLVELFLECGGEALLDCGDRKSLRSTSSAVAQAIRARFVLTAREGPPPKRVCRGSARLVGFRGHPQHLGFVARYFSGEFEEVDVRRKSTDDTSFQARCSPSAFSRVLFGGSRLRTLTFSNWDLVPPRAEQLFCEALAAAKLRDLRTLMLPVHSDADFLEQLVRGAPELETLELGFVDDPFLLHRLRRLQNLSVVLESAEAHDRLKLALEKRAEPLHRLRVEYGGDDDVHHRIWAARRLVVVTGIICEPEPRVLPELQRLVVDSCAVEHFRPKLPNVEVIYSDSEDFTDRWAGEAVQNCPKLKRMIVSWHHDCFGLRSADNDHPYHDGPCCYHPSKDAWEVCSEPCNSFFDLL